MSPRSRRQIIASGTAGISLLCATVFTADSRLLVWNTTASLPRGLYARVSGNPMRGDIVLAWLPAEMPALAASRRYLPRAVPALKPVAAIAGDTVCATQDGISVNGRPVVNRALFDHLGRAMPTWEGCQTLAPSQVFLLSTYAPDSFDGRYFGPSETGDVIEKVAPVWTLP